MFPSSKEAEEGLHSNPTRPPPPRVNLQQYSNKTLSEPPVNKKITLGSKNSSLQSNASLNKKKQPMIRL